MSKMADQASSQISMILGNTIVILCEPSLYYNIHIADIQHHWCISTMLHAK